MKGKTMKIRNVTGETFEMFNPIQQTFNPGEVVEVTYSLGMELTGRLQFDEVEEKGTKTKRSKKVK